ncbi:MAG: 2-amino-4-hydroxy-6-hydroxymethyldihydropteridine diphosphokinase [Chthoniobacteraceae bacterium]|nr:2-amino-4-hydroxy-6-hydroxymethyldihydropteridine diphosphokinase [Chthoniobacteraceae bacterium]
MRCGIALGSNLGDRLAHLRAAVAALRLLHAGPEPPLVSPVYETEPVDCEPDSPAYLNAVMEIRCERGALGLLRALQQIEHREGRPAAHDFHAPRTLDLDLLYLGDTVLQSPALTLPHPRIALRRFVLQPLADIRPEFILPGHTQPVAELLAGLPASPGVRLFPQNVQ